MLHRALRTRRCSESGHSQEVAEFWCGLRKIVPRHAASAPAMLRHAVDGRCARVLLVPGASRHHRACITIVHMQYTNCLGLVSSASTKNRVRLGFKADGAGH